MIDVKTIFSAQKRLLKKILKKTFPNCHIVRCSYNRIMFQANFPSGTVNDILKIVFHVYKRMLGINESLNILRRRRNKDSAKLKFPISHTCKKLLTSLNLLTPLTNVM